MKIIPRQLEIRLERELGFDSEDIAKMYIEWEDAKWSLRWHFVIEEPFERELYELTNLAFEMFNRMEQK